MSSEPSFRYSTTLSLKHCIRSNRNITVASDGHPLQFVDLRMRFCVKWVSSYSHQTIQRTIPIPISDALFHFPLRELFFEDPQFLFKFFLLRFLSPYNLPPDISDDIIDKISSFAFELAGGNLNMNFHIIDTVDFVYTYWVEDEEPELVVPAPASVIEKVMKEKYDGNGRDEKGDQCVVCYEDLIGEEELSRIVCGHVYHKCCVLKWLKINNSCPLCRMELRE